MNKNLSVSNLFKNRNIINVRAKYNSMFPFIKNGDKIVLRKISPSDIQAGFIYAYLRDNEIIMHRFIRFENKKLLFKGDNNLTFDILVDQNDVIAQLYFVIKENKNTTFAHSIILRKLYCQFPKISYLNYFYFKLLNTKILAK
jgi:signal peptidase I